MRRSCVSDGRGPRPRAQSAGARRSSRRACAPPRRRREAASRSGGRSGTDARRISPSSCADVRLAATRSRGSRTSQRRPSYGESQACAKIETSPVWTIAPASAKSSAAGPFGAEHVRLEARVEMADELRERRRRAAELRPVVNVEDRDPVRPREDPRVDRLDPPRVAGGVEVLLRVRARRAAERLSAVGVLEQFRDRVGDRFDAVVGDEHAGLAGDDDAAARARARRDDGDAARRRLDDRAAELRALRRRDDDVGGLVEVRRVLRERDEADDVVEPELVDELLRLRLVVARQVGRAAASARRRCGRTPGRERRRRRRGSSRRRRDRAGGRLPR